jgi:hypothetical protein
MGTRNAEIIAHRRFFKSSLLFALTKANENTNHTPGRRAVAIIRSSCHLISSDRESDRKLIPASTISMDKMSIPIANILWVKELRSRMKAKRAIPKQKRELKKGRKVSKCIRFEVGGLR